MFTRFVLILILNICLYTLVVSQVTSPNLQPKLKPSYSPHTTTISDTAQKLRLIFVNEIGVRQTGHNTGPRVEQYLSATHLGPGYAWCGAFLAFGYDSAGLNRPAGSAAAWSPAWFPQSRRISKPLIRESDVFGIYFQNLGRIAHVGYVDAVGITVLSTIEGNTNSSGGRTGHSVLRKKRPLKFLRKNDFSRWY